MDGIGSFATKAERFNQSLAPKLKANHNYCCCTNCHSSCYSSQVAGSGVCSVAAFGKKGAGLKQQQDGNSKRKMKSLRSRLSVFQSYSDNKLLDGGHLPLATNKQQKQLLRYQHKQQNQSGDRWMQMRAPRVGAKLLVCLSMLILLAFGYFISVVEGVDCFKCSSRNGSNPACEDPFHNLNTTRITSPVLPEPPPNVIYHTPCYAGKKGRDGLFPASACIKLIGTFDNTGERLVVRHCALDSGTLTQDTELARMSHCGKFSFDGDSLQGCVLACPEDACNSANGLVSRESLWRPIALALACAAPTILRLNRLAATSARL